MMQLIKVSKKKSKKLLRKPIEEWLTYMLEKLKKQIKLPMILKKLKISAKSLSIKLKWKNREQLIKLLPIMLQPLLHEQLDNMLSNIDIYHSGATIKFLIGIREWEYNIYLRNSFTHKHIWSFNDFSY